MTGHRPVSDKGVWQQPDADEYSEHRRRINLHEAMKKIEEIAREACYHNAKVWMGKYQPRTKLCSQCGKTIISSDDIAEAHYESVAMNEGFGNGGETWTCRECFAGTGSITGGQQTGENQVGSQTDDPTGRGENKRHEGY